MHFLIRSEINLDGLCPGPRFLSLKTVTCWWICFGVLHCPRAVEGGLGWVKWVQSIYSIWLHENRSGRKHWEKPAMLLPPDWSQCLFSQKSLFQIDLQTSISDDSHLTAITYAERQSWANTVQHNVTNCYHHNKKTEYKTNSKTPFQLKIHWLHKTHHHNVQYQSKVDTPTHSRYFLYFFIYFLHCRIIVKTSKLWNNT